MRSVPHRVVCLLGLDDGVFPRQRTVDGDDVLARTPVTGERDVRSEDRQLLLDAIGAATEKLVVTYTGADPHSGQDRPARRTPRRAARRPRPHHRGAGARRHRRQAPAPGLRPAQRRARPARHAHAVHLRPADAGGRDRRRPGRGPPRRRSSSGRWPSRSRGPAPTRSPWPTWSRSSATRSRGSSGPSSSPCPGTSTAVSDAMPVEIDQLETWGVGDRMLDDMMRGIHPDTAREIEWRRGALPPGQLGLAQGHRGPRDRDEPRGRRAHPPPGRAPGLRRRHRPARRPAAHRHHHPGLRRPAGRGRLLQARRQAPARVLGPAARARGRPPRPQLDRADHRPRPARHPGRPAAAGPGRRGAAHAALRTGRPLRRGPAGPAAAAAQDVVRLGLRGAHGPGPQARRRSRSGGPAASPARTPTRPTSGSGASTPTSTS